MKRPEPLLPGYCVVKTNGSSDLAQFRTRHAAEVRAARWVADGHDVLIYREGMDTLTKYAVAAYSRSGEA